MPHRHEALLGPSLSFCPRRMGTRHLQDPKTLLALTSPAGLRTLFFLAFTSEVSTWAWSKERPLTLGSGRFCSLSSSVKGVGREAQCPGEHRGGPRQPTPVCCTVQNRERTWHGPFLFPFPRAQCPLSGNPTPENQVSKQLHYPFIKNLS